MFQIILHDLHVQFMQIIKCSIQTHPKNVNFQYLYYIKYVFITSKLFMIWILKFELLFDA